MPRTAREKVANCIYHVWARGNNKQNIFLDEQDYLEYLKRLKKYKERYKMWILGYCIMTNHVHLLIYDNNQDISKFMHGLNSSYVKYFNKKYGRSGHVFEDRFGSSMVRNDAYFLYVSKYIHLNPVKAQIVEEPQDYRWTSYHSYMSGKDKDGIVDCLVILRYFQTNSKMNINKYKTYVEDKVFEEADREMQIKIDDEFEKRLIGIPNVSGNIVCKKLGEKWKVDVRKLVYLKENIDEERSLIVFYITALLARMTYKQIQKFFCISVNKAYELIWKVTKMMLENKHFNNKINNLIKYFQREKNVGF